VRRSSVLWIIAFLITLASAAYQRRTGPSYPVSGKVTLGDQQISYRLPRTQADGDALVSIAAAEPVRGVLTWKRFGTEDPWTYLDMQRSCSELRASLPHQPPAGKLAYRVILQNGSERVTLGGEPIVIRFRGEVPLAVLVIHVTCMFLGMLVSTRTGLEVFTAKPNYKGKIAVTLSLLTVGGLILGPIVQKHAFGAYWTGWPFGTDLTDNKTAVAWLGWAAAWVAVRRSSKPGRWVLMAAVLTLVVFAIPHSLFGSELKYSKQSPSA